MAVNDLTFNQLSTVLAAITSQATGKTTIAPVTTADFVTVGTTALKTGYDPVLNAVSQVLSRTIFSTRPYNRKFPSLAVTNQQYGNHVRKLQVADKAFEDDNRMSLTDGQSVDQYTVNKPNILQTNFYGANVYQKSLTLFRDQLDCAFSSPDEFASFVSMVMTNATDMIEQAHETTARATIANFIGGKVAGDTDNVIHLVTGYNDVTGLSLDSDSVMEPENFTPFTRWAFARIETLCDQLAERSVKFHKNVNGKAISRHTPADALRMYLLAPFMNNVNTSVLSATFNDNYMKLAATEKVGFWQALDTPSGINVKPTYMATDGTLTTPTNAVAQSNVIGVLFDREAMGYTTVNEWSAPTPFNAKGGYSNMFWHFTDRYWNDFTENGIVLCLD